MSGMVFLPSNIFPGICIAVSFPRRILFRMMAQTSRFVIVKVNREIGKHAASKVRILSGWFSSTYCRKVFGASETTVFYTAMPKPRYVGYKYY